MCEHIPLEKGGITMPARGHNEMSNLMEVMKNDLDTLMDEVSVLKLWNKTLEEEGEQKRSKYEHLSLNAEEFQQKYLTLKQEYDALAFAKQDVEADLSRTQ